MLVVQHIHSFIVGLRRIIKIAQIVFGGIVPHDFRELCSGRYHLGGRGIGRAPGDFGAGVFLDDRHIGQRLVAERPLEEELLEFAEFELEIACYFKFCYKYRKKSGFQFFFCMNIGVNNCYFLYPARINRFFRIAFLQSLLLICCILLLPFFSNSIQNIFFFCNI